jgi:hypothetical protein
MSRPEVSSDGIVVSEVTVSMGIDRSMPATKHNGQATRDGWFGGILPLTTTTEHANCTIVRRA